MEILYFLFGFLSGIFFWSVKINLINYKLGKIIGKRITGSGYFEFNVKFEDSDKITKFKSVYVTKEVYFLLEVNDKFYVK